MRKVSQLPGPGILAELTALIDARVEARLQALGGFNRPDPRALRIRKGLTVGELAVRSGCSVGVISKIENGKAKRPAVETLDALARALGVTETEYRDAVAGILKRSA